MGFSPELNVGKPLTVVILRSVPALPTVRFKNFEIVWSTDFRLAADLIESGRVRFRVVDPALFTSSYNDQNTAGAAANRLSIAMDQSLLSFKLPNPATIVHEACHIVFDYRKMKGKASASEAVAYVCQVMYMMATQTPWKEHTDPELNKISLTARSIGEDALARKAIPASEWRTLERAILKHPIYSKRGLKPVTSDGVP